MKKPSERIEELLGNRSGVTNYVTALIQYLDEEYDKKNEEKPRSLSSHGVPWC